MLPAEPSLHLNVLVASSTAHSPFTTTVLSELSKLDHISVRVLLARSTPTDTWPAHLPNGEFYDPKEDGDDVIAHRLCRWAHLLVLAPLDADSLARMLHGLTGNLLLNIIRSWDVSKKILLIPGMSALMWENPMTKKQLSKIRRKWNWIRLLQPLLWTSDKESLQCLHWEGAEDLVKAVETLVNLMTIGHGLDMSMVGGAGLAQPSTAAPRLPPELWSMILESTGDWELATALNVHTRLPIPKEWEKATSRAGPQTFMEKLEWTILVGNLTQVKALLEENPGTSWLSRLCIKLIMRFGMVDLLRYLETSHKELFWSTFGHTFLPDKASSVFGNIQILEFWRTSPSFLTKEYTAEAMDGASRSGFVHVLDWWYRSGLPLRYTETALEQASSKGRIDVLEWWKSVSTYNSQVALSHSSDGVSTPSSMGGESSHTQPPPLRLKPGKSISYATQSGSLPTVRWWAHSGIPFPHEETVTKLASTHGHVPILSFWRSLRGDKIIFDNQVLVGATKMGHEDVLEWWRQSGLRVEYKTCDIEEALEDGVEGQGGEEVRRWWARNGLNLGVGTSEWMRTKVL